MTEAEIIQAQKELIVAQQNLISMLRSSGKTVPEKPETADFPPTKDREEILSGQTRGEITLSEYAATFLKSRKNATKKSTYHNYVWLLNKHILPELGDRELGGIDNICLQEFTDEKLKTLSKKTVRDLVGLIKNIMNDAFLNDIVAHKRFMIKYPKSENSAYRTLTEEDFKKLEDYLLLQKKPYAIGELILLETGMRIGEMCGLKWGDINLTSGTIQIKSTVQRIYDSEIQKTNLNIGSVKTSTSERVIPMNTLLHKYLIQHKQDTDIYVATGKETPTEPRSQRAHHARILKKIGIEYIPPHGLRHTFATRAIQNNVDPKTVSAILGHSNSNITLNIYTSVTEDMMRRGMERMVPYGKGKNI